MSNGLNALMRYVITTYPGVFAKMEFWPAIGICGPANFCVRNPCGIRAESRRNPGGIRCPHTPILAAAHFRNAPLPYWRVTAAGACWLPVRIATAGCPSRACVATADIARAVIATVVVATVRGVASSEIGEA